MQTLWDALSGAPWWVYALFVYLVIVGLKATRSVTVSMKFIQKMALVPFVFIAWSLYSLFSFYGFSVSKAVLWLAALVIGLLSGWVMSKKIKIEADKKKRHMRLPGSYAPLVLILLIFSTKYYFGYTYAIDPLSKTEPLFFVVDIFLSGGISGIFLGRFLCLLNKYRHTPHSDL